MKKNTLLLVSLAVAALLIISYCRFQSDEESIEAPVSDSELQGTPAEETASANPATDAANNASAGFLPTQMEDTDKFEAFQKHLKDLGTCLDIKTNPLDPQAEINFETLHKVISLDLGDIVTTVEDWAATDIRTKSGELRRIYLENAPDMDAGMQKSLKYFSLSEDGTQKELPLSQEQMSNPSDTLIASLESDGELVAKSVSRRMFYQNGDDLSLVEKNGKIFSFDLPHEGKVFSCSGADSAQTMTCKCK